MCLASTIFVSRVSRMAMESRKCHCSFVGVIINYDGLLQDCLPCLWAGWFKWGTLHCGCNHHPLYQVPRFHPQQSQTVPNNPQLSQITETSTLWTDRHGKSILKVLQMFKKKYFSLAVFFWTNVMAWDIYKTFGQRTILSHIRPTGKDHLKSNYHQDTIRKHSGWEKAVLILWEQESSTNNRIILTHPIKYDQTK